MSVTSPRRERRSRARATSRRGDACLSLMAGYRRNERVPEFADRSSPTPSVCLTTTIDHHPAFPSSKTPLSAFPLQMPHCTKERSSGSNNMAAMPIETPPPQQLQSAAPPTTLEPPPPTTLTKAPDPPKSSENYPNRQKKTVALQQCKAATTPAHSLFRSLSLALGMAWRGGMPYRSLCPLTHRVSPRGECPRLHTQLNAPQSWQGSAPAAAALPEASRRKSPINTRRWDEMGQQCRSCQIMLCSCPGSCCCIHLIQAAARCCDAGGFGYIPSGAMREEDDGRDSTTRLTCLGQLPLPRRSWGILVICCEKYDLDGLES
ncbi:hypothetical protein BJ508DRAFT_315945 [Ascobolus immersus RN42]|uniref:Uncharacterized protein n=1 Tax=Ascobolus immersus RN42 TaxID=1160509 RepID=A0A3N4H8L1_ASCIM|nr:hypothetical protein BJ508DRAFT_315945 [Ascobolus immersus RN42]